MTTRLSVPVLWVVASVGTAAAGPEVHGPPAPSPAFELVDGTWVRRADSCGTRQIPGPIQPAAAAAAQQTVYLNRNGGTYRTGQGATNSSTNAALIGANETVVIPALASDFNWTNIRNCVITHYGPYNVVFTETEPTGGTYLEAVVGGTGTEIDIGFGGGGTLLGVASADNFCNVTTRGIAFSFSEAHRGIPRRDDELCATIAHEIAHLLALEHETLAIDLMSYVEIHLSSTKAFVDQASPCGTYPGQNQSCSCSAGQTNSAQRLLTSVGAGTPTPPHMMILDPAEGDEVAPGFPVLAEGDEALARVELRVDGQLVQTITTPPYAFNAPDDLGEGGHRVEIRGFDLALTQGSAFVDVTIGEPCQSPDDCDAAGENYTCVGGRCVPGAGAPGGLGELCTSDEECFSGLCLTSGADQRCVEGCDPGQTDCPSGFDCLDFEQSGVCWPNGEGGGGGGCSSSQGGRDAVPIGIGLAVAGLIVLRRRRRP